MSKKTSLFPMLIIGVLFFIFGFVTWLNGSLIPFLQIICDLSEFEALFVTFAFYIAYTVMALPMSYILGKIGYKNAMALGLFIMAVGSLLFIPAALSGAYLVFLFALFTLATGLTLLQSASNPYVVLIGPQESAAVRISIMGLLNKFAGVLAPLIFTALIVTESSFGSQRLSDSDIQALTTQLMFPYIVMALMLFFLMLIVKLSPLPAIEYEEQDALDTTSIFSYAHTVLGAIALFFYVGIEVIAGDTIGLYAQSLGLESATMFTSYTMGFMVLGYLLGIIAIARFISQQGALVVSALLGIVFIAGVVYSSPSSYAISSFVWGYTTLPLIPDTLFFVALLGLSNALVWPTIWPLALKGLGRHTPQASALLIMAIAGGALLPLVFGKLSEYLGSMQEAYLLGLLCYAFILMYGLFWHKKRAW